MLSPQDIIEKKFEKATFGGYDMGLVDDFLEQLSQDYATLYKENAILKSKLKVLVEKVEEYRSTEDSMRMALLTAQKMGAEIIDESKKKADVILAEVGEQAQIKAAELRQKLAAEEARLAEAERQTAIFSSRVLDLIAGEKRFLEQLRDLAVAVPAAEPAKAAPAPAPAQKKPKSAPVPPKAAASVPVVPVTPVAPVAPAEPASPVQTEIASFIAGEMAASAMPRDPFDNEPGLASEVDFLKMFDQDHIEETPLSQPALPQDDRAEEKIDIARSISSALGDTEEIVDKALFYDDEGQPTTKRPKFDFDDLQFGTNYEDDE